MSCIAYPKLALPDLSLLIPALPDIPLAIAVPGVPLPCCSLPPIPVLQYTIPLGTMLALLGPGLNSVLAPIQTQIDAVNALIDQIPPITCPDWLEPSP